MENDERIIELLTEIRDTLQGEAELRAKVSQESLRLSRLVVSRQKTAMVVGVVLLIALAAYLAYFFH